MSQRTQDEIEPEEYAFYANQFQDAVAVIVDHTRGSADRRFLQGLVDKNEVLMSDLLLVGESIGVDLAQETVDDYIAKNERSYALTSVNLGANCIFISEQEGDEIMRTWGDEIWWNAFYKKYNLDHFVTISRVGFNREKDQALFYVWVQSKSTTESRYYFYEKKNGIWSEQGKVGRDFGSVTR